MTGWQKLLVIALPAALMLTAAWRFIEHTDRDYTYWIRLHGESVAWLEARCAELHTPGACGTAQERRTFLTALETYRARVTAWRGPAVVAMLIAWIGAGAAVIAIVWEWVRRRP
jgi:hypothetical protein